MTQDSITLYLTEEKAKEAAQQTIKRMGQGAYRIIRATLKAADRSVDRGFKVAIHHADMSFLYFL